ncbi:alkaline phosphatase [Candidatus Neomarinimicrobiota bacterium]
MVRTKIFSILTPLVIIIAGLLLVQSRENVTDNPKSIILIIADGTGIGQHSYSYYFTDNYAPAKFDHVGLVTTHSADKRLVTTSVEGARALASGVKITEIGEWRKVTDSAAGGTALSSGVKTYNSAIGVNAGVEPVKNITEYAHEMNMATGLVATSSITSATPASFAAHIDKRDKEDIIAQQMADSEINVLLGGGQKFFNSKANGGVQEINLLQKMHDNGVQVVTALDEISYPADRLVGLFSDGGLPRAIDGRSPTTSQMAEVALKVLETDDDGFFLMIEESQVDWAGHDNESEYLLGELESLNDLVDFVLAYQAKNPNVLVILTADHETGGLSVVNKSKGPGLESAWKTTGHTGNFVPVFATGPGGDYFDGLLDNTDIAKQLITMMLAE